MGKQPSTSTNPAYWEKQLKKYGLGIYQPITDNSKGEMGETNPDVFKRANQHTHDHKQTFVDLRTIGIDGSDQFMDGHQIMKVQTKDRVIPEWAFNRAEIARILLTAFPKMQMNTSVGKSQRARAGKWARLIHLYYRMGQPQQIVSKELGIDPVLFKRWVQKIKFVEQGLTIDGKPRRRHLPDMLVRDPGERNEHIESALLPTAGTGGTREGGTTSEILPMPQDD